MKKLTLIFVFLWFSDAKSLSVGSRATPSDEGAITFPACDKNNAIVGFAHFKNGFRFQDQTTSCTFDSCIPISGSIALNGGKLVLEKDLIFTNNSNFKSGGKISAQGLTIELPKQAAALHIPAKEISTDLTGWKMLGSQSMGTSINSVDWSHSDNYLGATSSGSATDEELKIYYFDGLSLTTTQAIDLGKTVYSARWHPTHNYVTIGAASGTGNELLIYKFNQNNGTLVNSFSQNFSSYVASEAWHTSGQFLVIVVGTQIISYTFNPETGSATNATSLNIPGARGFQRDSITFAPGGNRFVVGSAYNPDTNGSELIVCSFRENSLSITTSVNLDRTVAAADWSPTGSYIATGLSFGTESVRIYKHNDSPSESLSLVSQALIHEILVANDIQWSHDGNYLAVGVSGGISSYANIYSFDKEQEKLSLIISIPVVSNVNTLRWSHDDTLLCLGLNSGNVIVFQLKNEKNSPITLENAILSLNSEIVLDTQLYFTDKCKIKGNGKTLHIGTGAALIVRPNAQVILENVQLFGAKGNNLSCMNHTGEIILKNSLVYLDADVTFSQGAIFFEGDVGFAGNSKFVYSSARASTIATNAQWYLGHNMTLSYAPTNNKKNLLQMTDKTSKIFLDGCTFHATKTGTLLDKGSLFIDNTVTISCEARHAAEAFEFGPDLSVSVLGGAQLNLFGIIKAL